MTTPSSALLDYPNGLRVLGIDIDPFDLAVPIQVLITTTSKRARCPECGRYANRVHSRYQRTLRDLPCAGRALVAQVRVRRFRCTSRRCKTKLFCERLGELAEPYARRTRRMNTSLVHIAMAEGGRAGSRLAETLGLHANRMTLLRLVRALPDLPVTTPTVLGVDDFALRRGHNYATILYDLEGHEVIDLLPDRSAESLATWLRAHPGIEIISRDRADVYAQGSREGAPDAQQVADRWHLLNNLGEALERFLSQHQSALKQAACQDSVSPDITEQTEPEPAIGSGERSGDNAQAESDRGANVPISLPVSGSTTKSAWRNKVEVQVACHRVARMARYKEICRLHDEGHTNKAIGAHMGMAQSTVGKFLRAQQFPERAERPLVTGKLGPFHKYIQECWDAGNRNVKQLLLQLKQLGYTGSLTMLSRDIQLLRQQSKPSCTLQAGAGKFSARQVVSILLMPDRTPEQQTLLERLTTKNALFAKARGLAEAFTALIRKRPREDAHVALGLWVADAMSSPISAVASFARGLRDDWEAVVAGLSLEWSQGPVEGAVNRIKMIKRQMFGRANFDLLRRRVLPAP